LLRSLLGALYFRFKEPEGLSRCLKRVSYEARVAMSEDLADVVILSAPGMASIGLGVVVLIVGLSGLLLATASPTPSVAHSLVGTEKPSTQATAVAPEVTSGERQRRGSLGKEVIRRVIRRHLNEVKRCYEEASTEKRDLSGHFMLKFTISGVGAVVASEVERTTMSDSAVAACVSQAVRRWRFPKPEGGGSVIVSYPFWLCGAGND
jgi:hypothetical protein